MVIDVTRSPLEQLTNGIHIPNWAVPNARALEHGYSNHTARSKPRVRTVCSVFI